MATTYEPAVEATRIAQDLIERHHRHLEQARIVWLKTGTGQSRARACNALLAHAFGRDASGVFPAFCVVVTDADWFARKGAARVALIDTLLCSMTRQSNADTGKDRWAIAKPDVSLYLAVVKRHGLNTTEEQQVGKLIKDLPEQLALAMDSDDQDDEDNPNGNQPWEDEEPAEEPRVTHGFERADGTWQDAEPPELNDQAVREIRGSVEAAVK